LSTPERLPSCRIRFFVSPRRRESRFRLWIRPRNPYPRTGSPRDPSTRSSTTIRAGSFEARSPPARPIPRGLHPALLETSLWMTIAIRATDFCYRTVTTSTHDAFGYPRLSVWLTPGGASIRRLCDEPSRMNRAFHDARLASTLPFDLRSGVVFPTKRRSGDVSDAPVASPTLARSRRRRRSTRPRSRRALLLVKGG
jgi:hypothetical protein